MEFGVHRLPLDKSVIDYYSPKLDFLKRYALTDTQVRILLLMFDPESPLANIESIEEKAYYALVHSGLQPDEITMSFDEEMKKCAILENSVFNEAAVAYLVAKKKAQFATISVLEFGRIKLLAQLLAGDNNALKALDDFELRIRKRKAEFTGIDNTRLLDAIDSLVYEDQLDLSAEGQAKKRAQGIEVFPEVKNYTV